MTCRAVRIFGSVVKCHIPGAHAGRKCSLKNTNKRRMFKTVSPFKLARVTELSQVSFALDPGKH